MINRMAGLALRSAIHSQVPVTGLTHGFYRYPARFSPIFVHSAIKAFTKPGDVVLDPFMGGGTTLVEARVLGRRAIGVDTNSLAVFIAKVKTTLLSEDDLKDVNQWARNLVEQMKLRNTPVRATKWAMLGYQRNINGVSTWPIRKTLELALAQLDKLSSEAQRNFARCVLLRTAQWSLDCRVHIPSVERFRQQFCEFMEKMIADAREFTSAATNADRLYSDNGSFRTLCLHRSIEGIETELRLANSDAPALIITSPPYPGVHVVYHRWQIHSRKETPAPYWIANCLDGNGASFYTFGDRKQTDLTAYYDRAKSSFSSLAQIVNDKTSIVQMIAFSDPSWQLQKYLSVMKDVGFREVKFPALSNSSDGRVWRSVPNRKWYASQKGATATSKEVVLFHRHS